MGLLNAIHMLCLSTRITYTTTAVNDLLLLGRRTYCNNWGTKWANASTDGRSQWKSDGWMYWQNDVSQVPCYVSHAFSIDCFLAAEEANKLWLFIFNLSFEVELFCLSPLLSILIYQLNYQPPHPPHGTKWSRWNKMKQAQANKVAFNYSEEGGSKQGKKESRWWWWKGLQQVPRTTWYENNERSWCHFTRTGKGKGQRVWTTKAVKGAAEEVHQSGRKCSEIMQPQNSIFGAF